jgi:hypothetical protein
MTAVDGDPADDLTLEAHRPGDGQHDPERRRRGEAAVGEQTVEADGHPKPCHQVESRREQDVCEVQAVAPCEPYRHPKAAERHDDDRERHRYPDRARDRVRRAAGVREWLRAFITGSELISHRGRSFLVDAGNAQNTATARPRKYARQCQQAVLNRRAWSSAPPYKSRCEYLPRAPASR